MAPFNGPNNDNSAKYCRIWTAGVGFSPHTGRPAFGIKVRRGIAGRKSPVGGLPAGESANYTTVISSERRQQEALQMLRVRYSATCEPLDAAEVQNSTFSIDLTEFGIAGYYNPGRLWRAGSQDTDLCGHVPISTFYCII